MSSGSEFTRFSANHEHGRANQRIAAFTGDLLTASMLNFYSTWSYWILPCQAKVKVRAEERRPKLAAKHKPVSYLCLCCSKTPVVAYERRICYDTVTSIQVNPAELGDEGAAIGHGEQKVGHQLKGPSPVTMCYPPRSCE